MYVPYSIVCIRFTSRWLLCPTRAVYIGYILLNSMQVTVMPRVSLHGPSTAGVRVRKS